MRRGHIGLRAGSWDASVAVALSQFRPTKGRPGDNLDRIEATFREIAAAVSPPAVLIFPEGIVTGYFLEGGVREHALTASDLFDDLAARHARSGAPPLDVCLGFYEAVQGHLYNSVMWAALGGPDQSLRHVHRRYSLPTYGVLDEERFVSGPGHPGG